MITYTKRLIQRLIVSDEGATSVEYAIMLAMIILGAIGAILSTGDIQELMWQDTADAMGQNMGN